MKSSRPAIRGRNMLSNSNSTPSVEYAASLYDHQGDSVVALDAYRALGSNELNFSQAYNQSLLAHLAEGDDSFIQKIGFWKEQWDTETNNGSFPSRKKTKRGFILKFNESLVIFGSGKPREASEQLISLLRPMIAQKEIVHEELLNITVNMAFLVLDCILALSEGSHDGLNQLDDICTSEALTTWLELQDLDSDAQLKFRLQIYKSRLDFSQHDQIHGTVAESKVRGIKKELKQAMELFNQKIRTTGETISIGSSSDRGDDIANQRNHREKINQLNIEIGTQDGLLQAHHQSALNLKGRLEQLKGNTKKSLLLSAEARSSHNDPSYECVDLNNHAIIYATSHKRYLALHSAAKALSAPRGGIFRSDGMVRCDTTWVLLANTALCALQAGRYEAAYECMASCVVNSKKCSDRPRCWLRLAEACIGLHVEKLKLRSRTENGSSFAVVEDNGKPTAIFARLTYSDDSGKRGGSNSTLGSKEDMEYCKKYPLQQASFCLDRVMKLLRDASIGSPGLKMDRDCLESARCAQSYVMLELKEYKQALFLAKLLLMDAATRKETSGLHNLMHKRRKATASMYGCEACCALGDAAGALKFLTGENEDDSTLDRLAADLAGVGTLPTPNNVNSKDITDRMKRVKIAQAMVRTSASAATAAMGRLGTAKKLAMSAISLEDEVELSEAASCFSARKALLYCMLKEGNRDGALSVLRSSR